MQGCSGSQAVDLDSRAGTDNRAGAATTLESRVRPAGCGADRIIKGIIVLARMANKLLRVAVFMSPMAKAALEGIGSRDRCRERFKPLCARSSCE